jgi:hypothetical protein
VVEFKIVQRKKLISFKEESNIHQVITSSN